MELAIIVGVAGLVLIFLIIDVLDQRGWRIF